MADYHPLISRAVAGLEKNTGENRRVLYERARDALLNQLRSVDPPLEESDITHERLALEEAIRKVEAEAAKSAPAQAKQSAPPASDEAVQETARETAPETPRETRPETSPPSSSAGEQGLHDWRETMAEAENLGGATAKARRSAREFLEAVPGGATSGTQPERASEPPSKDEAPPAPRRSSRRPEGAPPPSYEEMENISPRPARSWGGIVKLVLLVVVIAALAGAGYWQRKPLLAMLAQLHAGHAPKTQQAAAPSVQPKINDRVAASKVAPKKTTAPAVAVAQKVVLIEQDPNNPQGKSYVGSAIWRTETVSPGTGLAPELAVRANIDIPERHMRMTWSLRRNTDKAMTAASHTIEIQFTLPANFNAGGISKVPGVLMKTGEDTRGLPLAGLSVKVTDGYFLIGLSADAGDQKRNIVLLKNRDWVEIPIYYSNGRQAIMRIEKGPPGDRAFAEAFRSWGE
jgi:hypothetical protein